MHVLQFLTGRRNPEPQPVQFTPSIIVHPGSTLYVECTPGDPHTASNIVINSYPSKSNRTNLLTKIQWRRYKILADSEHTNTHLPFITGNAYRCEPGDLGYYIHAKIVSYDVAVEGSAEVTVGPIRLDPTVKQLIEGALYSGSLRSQVKVYERSQARNVDLLLTDRAIKFQDEVTAKIIEVPYSITEPKIQVNPKDPTKIFLRFENDETNKVRTWLDTIFNLQGNFDTQSKRSINSQGSGSSKNKIFNRQVCVNKVEVQFLTRHSRDQFIFSMRAFVARESMKNTALIDMIEGTTQISTPEDCHKFFKYMSLKTEIYRLANLARELEIDRDMKLKDLQDVEQTITETTTAYIQLLQKKGKEIGIDFNQSFSEVSIRRDQIMGKKKMRQLEQQNKGLKERIRELNVQLEFKQFCIPKNNESQLFNRTIDPFAKKKIISNDSYYNPLMANEVEQQHVPKSVVELSKSYANLWKENEKLKEERKQILKYQSPHKINQSASHNDMENLLESLQEEELDPQERVKKLKAQVKQLKLRIQQLAQQNKKIKSATSIKLNQSVAYQQQQQQAKQKSQLLNQDSVLDYTKQEGSFYSVSQSAINESMTSEAGILLLENKIKEIDLTNKKILAENDRLRKQRNDYRGLYEQLKKGAALGQGAAEAKNAMSSSTSYEIQTLKQQNEGLLNEKNSLLRKIESLAKQASKGGDSMLEKKCEQLTRQNNFLRQENESLKQRMETMKNSESTSEKSESFSQNFKQNDKLKKINSQLLEEIKNLRLAMERKGDPLYNSRIIELESEVNFFRNSGTNGQSLNEATKQLIEQISNLKKQVQRLRNEGNDKEVKLISQAVLIQRLMNSNEDNSGYNIGKDKSYSETRNDSETNEKLKKKIKQLQEEIVMMRRSADALNRSQDMSREMLSYSQEQMDIMRREKEMILVENERLSKMCERYSKDAREANKEANKWKQQAFELMKSQNKDQPSVENK